MIVEVSLTGDKELIAKFDSLPTAVMAALYAKVQELALVLEGHVKTRKLNGQVLNRITGALARSIFNDVQSAPEEVIGRVFSSGDVKYAGIHEYGGTTSPHVIVPKKAKALAFMGKGGVVFAQKVNHPGSVMPERSFLRSSLSDLSIRISLEMKSAVVQSIIDEVQP